MDVSLHLLLYFPAQLTYLLFGPFILSLFLSFSLLPPSALSLYLSLFFFNPSLVDLQCGVCFRYNTNIYIYIFFFLFQIFSFIGYYKVLTVVPCAI